MSQSPMTSTHSRLTIRRTLGLAALFGVASTASACVQDPDCGVCDPDNLVLEIISARNFAAKPVYLLDPECSGGDCPSEIQSGQYYLTEVGPCLETEEAKASPRGAEEYCKISPMASLNGIEFIFNNLLDPESIELVRKAPDNPNLFEVYDWKTRIVSITGPTTRFNGDYIAKQGIEPDIVTRAVNLTCVDNINLTEPYHEAIKTNPGLCSGFQDFEGSRFPVKMDPDGLIKAYDGRTSWQAGSCNSTSEGFDTCCTTCDYELAVRVAKYGVNGSGDRLRPQNGGPTAAVTCDPAGNVYEECAAFIPSVDRANEEKVYKYDWDLDGTITDAEAFALPRYDKLRETHPDDRPAGLEQRNFPCASDLDCFTGAQCVGSDTNGDACDDDSADCTDKRCQAEWFVECNEDTSTTGSGAYCVDKRFRDVGAAACFVTSSSFESCDPDGNCSTAPAGTRLSFCDSNQNGGMTAEECCQQSLGSPSDGAFCDPIYSQDVEPLERFDRDSTLPEASRDCFCGSPGNQRDECADQVKSLCAAPWGDGKIPEGEYVTRFVTATGGVVYDPAVKGFLFLPSDVGNQERALAEQCAELRGEIGARNIMDGWRMGDAGRRIESFEDFDRAMCSGSTYSIEFALEGEVLKDKVGNTLAGKSTYTFQTPEFHVVPGSGFPTDNLRIGACDAFRLDFSNKFDLDATNLRKLQLVQLEPLNAECAGSLESDCYREVVGGVVAGGVLCASTAEEADANNLPPCLTVDVTSQWLGEVGVVIDSVEFGKRLFEQGQSDPFIGTTSSGRYRVKVPGLVSVNGQGQVTQAYTSLQDAADQLGGFNSNQFKAVYEAAFHDACGMPLVTAGPNGETDLTDFYYDFTIDEPKCKEDRDFDGVQLSCDNAPKHFNPGQEDFDKDGIGDVIDKCTTVVDPTKNNSADSDKDGVGNECDACRQPLSSYNEEADNLGIPASLRVRGIPDQGDFDQDGIGDVCDNCVAVANCEGYGPSADGLQPFEVGDPIKDTDTNVCQQDQDLNMIGNACEGQQLPDAAGPVGFLTTEDLDQDGLPNAADFCPRQPVERVTCATDSECPMDSECDTDAGICNHSDQDADGVGNICDTCPYSPNPNQILDGGDTEDDPDGDFVGNACETASGCYTRNDPRPFAFYDVAVDGICCVTNYPGDGQYVDNGDGTFGCDGLCDPDGLPIRQNPADCPIGNQPLPGEKGDPNGVQCRVLPPQIALYAGVVNLPPGCQDALTAAGKGMGEEASSLDPESFSTDQEFWDNICFLPQWDQDFDGLGDVCDLCQYAFDPSNLPYIDPVTNKVFTTAGKYCFGEYDIELICADDEGGTTTTDTAGTTAGGTATTG